MEWAVTHGRSAVGVWVFISVTLGSNSDAERVHHQPATGANPCCYLGITVRRSKSVGEFRTNEKTREQLRSLALRLGVRQETILQRWREAADRVDEATVSSSLTRLQFNDHIPGVLDAYGHTLEARSRADSADARQEEKEQVIEHGLQRWQQGYQLRELTREWGQLEMCVMEELEDYTLEHPGLEPDVMRIARLEWSKLCWDGISKSTSQYWRMHQTEAAGHVRDLEQALAILNEIDQVRATAWRETAHDLQGGLSLVTLATSVLNRKDLPEQKRHEFSDLAQRGVLSLHEMLDDFMSLARLDAGLEQVRNTPFDAALLLGDFCKASQHLAQERGLFLKMEGPASLPVHGDQAKIRRILQNLLLNALKYTQRGGVVVIWKNLSDEGARNWMFCVQDTGPGLDDGPDAPMARQLHEATQASHSAETSHSGDTEDVGLASAPTLAAQSRTLPTCEIPGEGVGLSIVKRLCELLDATLELETSPGSGSTFRVVLPLRDDERAVR